MDLTYTVTIHNQMFKLQVLCFKLDAEWKYEILLKPRQVYKFFSFFLTYAIEWFNP